MPDYRSPPAGKLDCLLEIQERDHRKSDDGSLKPNWTTYARAYCSIEPLQGSEGVQAGSVGSEATHRIICHWLPGVTAKMRGLFAGRELEFTSVTNPAERGRRLEIFAKEAAPQNPPRS